MTTLVKCYKCKNEIKNREYLKCQICLNIYDINCGNVSIKRFLIMTKERKAVWKCRTCLHPDTVLPMPPLPETTTQIKFADSSHGSNINEELDEIAKPIIPSEDRAMYENVTLRRPPQNKRVKILETLSDPESELESESTTIFDGSSISLPYTPSFVNSEDSELSIRVETLSLQLASAHEEIDRLNGEISSMRKSNEDQEKKIDIYKKLLTEKGAFRKSTPVKKSQLSKKTISVDYLDSDDDTPQFLSPTCSQRGLDKSTQTNVSYTLDMCHTTQQTFHRRNVELATENNPHKATEDVSGVAVNQVGKKIVIISTDNSKKILVNAQRSFVFDSVCHFIKTNGSIEYLLEDIKTKTQGMTLRDFCVIFIGPTDFEKTYDYNRIIRDIRTKLNEIGHTNVIICLPNYKLCQISTLFNKRIESFNRALYDDACAHEYAYVFDTNKKLKYSSKMFTKSTGTVNNIAFKSMFSGLSEYISEIERFNEKLDREISHQNGTGSDCETSFFRR